MLDVRAFRRACYEAARRTDGRVIEFRMAGGMPNFHQGIIGYGGKPGVEKTVAVVGHCCSGIMAIAEPRVIESAAATSSGPLVFGDFPELQVALGEVATARVLTKAELDAPFHARNWPTISTADIAYWKPSTVGEALFNYWD